MLLPLLLALQQAFTTPPSGDTIGYWQQRADYTITAILDESAGRLRARGVLDYTNNSPDVLREIFLHQHLNAFRPGSMWSEVDEREGRHRFQELGEPDFAYERFTRTPIVDGVAAAPDYPFAPDSTVVRLPLPRALGPGESIRVELDWEARPSALPRRQGRRGRHWDFAHWYPRIAVYDRGGWQHNPLRPAGEFYGEFGTFDVTLVVRDDQIIGATGVPVEGDPGWLSAHRGGEVVLAREAYGAPADRTIPVDLPGGHRAVRWIARDVHHFAWSASPNYRYEGGVHVRPRMQSNVPHWDTVAVHVLYQPGDEQTWGNGVAVARTLTALRWLEGIFGPYGYPQITNLHRIEGGGTEFPMMMMNGSPSQGLIVHELAHVYVHGILANNEWRSGWIDEGLASYHSRWAQGMTPQERARAGQIAPPRLIAEGYRANAITMTREDSLDFAVHLHDIRGTAQPMGTPGHEFRDFATYSAMIYGRAERMFSHLRDLIGDEAFRAFHRDLYERWHYSHVDELALRASAERASGMDLRWFFEQWVHSTGLLDYALVDAESRQTDDGRWVTRTAIERRGDYAHAMPVGVRTARGWTIARGDPQRDAQTVEIVTDDRPEEIRLDPHRVTADWDNRNDVLASPIVGPAEVVFDWPFLDQRHRDRGVVAIAPLAWYSDPGGLTLGARARGNYAGTVDVWELGLGVASRVPPGASHVSRFQPWARITNPYFGGMTRPLYGFAGGAAYLDGILKLDASYRQTVHASGYAPGARTELVTAITTALPFDAPFLPEQWSDARLLDISTELLGRYRLPGAGIDSLRGRAALALGIVGHDATVQRSRVYVRAEVEGQGIRYFDDTATVLSARAYGAVSSNTPPQRAIYASALDPLSTFANHWYRPRGAILKQDPIRYLPLGGAGMRAYHPALAVDAILAGNFEAGRRILHTRGRDHDLGLWGVGFADIGVASGRTGVSLDGPLLADLGVGGSLRGRLYDRTVRVRVDFPLFVHQPAFAFSEPGRGNVSPRWSLTYTDLW
jgi:hypothetical protein